LVLASRTYKGPEGEPITLFQDVLDERTFQQQQQQEDYLALYTELALDELNATKPEYAAVLLAGVRGDSDEQIAADLGIDSLVTVRTRKSRARQKLREIIERLSKMGTSAAFRRAANIQREGREETDRVAPIRRRVI
jgi:DNA-directed RNA polymerase specialized sigma24 family protein